MVDNGRQHRNAILHVDLIFPEGVVWKEDFMRCSPWLEAALGYTGGTHNLQDILDGVLRGEYQFWPGERCAVITEIMNFPRKRVFNFFLAGGDLKELEAMTPTMEAWAKFRECDSAMLTGRKGWLRTFLPGRGYTAKWQTLSKEI